MPISLEDVLPSPWGRSQKDQDWPKRGLAIYKGIHFLEPPGGAVTNRTQTSQQSSSRLLELSRLLNVLFSPAGCCGF